jgi:prepilin-type N-terminal cleavage/methylation domain-containing protein
MSRRGFTLVEMLIAIAVLAILGGLVFGAWSVVDGQTRRALTETRVHTLGCKVAEQVGIKGFPPAVLSDLAEAMGKPAWMSDGKFMDGWDRPFEYSVTGKQFRLWSPGPDGISGTADDIEFTRR